jgi:hypothetical protein
VIEKRSKNSPKNDQKRALKTRKNLGHVVVSAYKQGL